MAKTREAVDEERIRRILEQAAEHGGLKAIEVPFASPVEAGRPGRRFPAGRHAGSAPERPRFEQLEFPWVLDPTWGLGAVERSHRH